jgi:GntR family transcriptional repressor for pyruvate dehydrogenase complex
MWEPLRQEGRVADRIVAQVERLILEERLKLGERLPSEREMAQLLNVSRPSLREAMRILQARGRLVVKHGQGIFLLTTRPERELRAALDKTDLTLKEMYAMREVLEVPAASWAAEHRTESQLRRLRATLDALNSAGEVPNAPKVNHETLRRLDADFHLTIAASAGNRFLRETSSVLHDLVISGMSTTLSVPGRLTMARAGHERIYESLAAHNPVAARQAARAHIRGAHAAAARRLELSLLARHAAS